MGTPKRSAWHRFERHTGEIRLHLWAPTWEGLLAEAGRALAELLTDEPGAASSEPLRVEARAFDREALLVEWIDTLIFHSERRKEVFTGFEFERAGDREVVAHVRGARPGHLRTPVKAATFHRLRVEERDGGFEATVVLDV